MPLQGQLRNWWNALSPTSASPSTAEHSSEPPQRAKASLPPPPPLQEAEQEQRQRGSDNEQEQLNPAQDHHHVLVSEDSERGGEDREATYRCGTQVRRYKDSVGWTIGSVVRVHDGKKSLYTISYDDPSVENEDLSVSEMDSAAALVPVQVGSHISVFWKDDKSYHGATVAKYQSDRRQGFLLNYDYGGREWLDLTQHQFHSLPDNATTGSQNQKREGKSNPLSHRQTGADALEQARGDHRKQPPSEVNVPVSEAGHDNDDDTHSQSFLDSPQPERLSPREVIHDSDTAARGDASSVGVGSRVSIWWPEDGAFYDATVVRIRDDENPFYLEFDDGEREWMDLSTLSFRALSAEDDFEDDMALDDENEHSNLRSERHFEDSDGDALSPPVQRKRIINLPVDETSPASPIDPTTENPRDGDVVEPSANVTVDSERENESVVQAGPHVPTEPETDSPPAGESVLPEGTRIVRGPEKDQRAVDNQAPSDRDAALETNATSRVTWPIVDNGTDQRPVDEVNDVDDSEKGSSVAEPDPTDDPDEVIVSSRIGVWWPDDHTYYNAEVISYRPRRLPFRILYDDGEEEWIDLNKHIFKFLPSSKRRQTALPARDAKLSLSKVSVGVRVGVWWEGNKEYYKATVKQVDARRNKSYFLIYDDGDKEWIDLRSNEFYVISDDEASEDENPVPGERGNPNRRSPGHSETRIESEGRAGEKMQDAESVETPQPVDEEPSAKEPTAEESAAPNLEIGTEDDSAVDENMQDDESAETSEPVAEESSAPTVTVGTRLSVYWEGEKQFYDGTVTAIKDAKCGYFIRYDDGDEEWTDLSVETYNILPPKRKRGRPPKRAQGRPTTTDADDDAEPSAKRSKKTGKRTGPDVLSIAIEQVDPKTGKVLNVWSSIRKAERMTGISRRHIRSVLDNLVVEVGDYQWRYAEPVEVRRGRAGRKPKDRPPIEQLCLETGDILAEFKSVSDARDAIGASQSCVFASVADGKSRSAMGYFWRWKGSRMLPKNLHGLVKIVRVSRGLTGTALREFRSSEAAAEWLGVEVEILRRWCREKRSAKGYYWSYHFRKKSEEELYVGRRIRIHLPSQRKLWEEGAVADFDSATGKHKIVLDNGHDEFVDLSTGTYHFRSETGDEPVEQLCIMTGKVLKKYPHARAAAKAVDTRTRWILPVLLNQAESACGFFWRFAGSDALPDPKLVRDRRPVEQLDAKTERVIQVHSSSTAAGKIVGVLPKEVTLCCSDRSGRTTAGGFRWKYAGVE